MPCEYVHHMEEDTEAWPGPSSMKLTVEIQVQVCVISNPPTLNLPPPCYSSATLGAHEMVDPSLSLLH